jgi:hypothetical protein
MFNKKAKPHRAFRKTNRIVEGTIIKEILYPKLILGLTEIGNFFSTGKLVIGPAGIITGDIQCKKCRYRR